MLVPRQGIYEPSPLSRSISLFSLCFPPPSSHVMTSQRVSTSHQFLVLASLTSRRLSSRPHPALTRVTPNSNFGALPTTVPLRPVITRVMASLHHFTPRQFLYTTSLPWLPLHRAHASGSATASLLPLMWPCPAWLVCNTLGVTLYNFLLKHCTSIILMCKCV